MTEFSKYPSVLRKPVMFKLFHNRVVCIEITCGCYSLIDSGDAFRHMSSGHFIEKFLANYVF